MKTCLYKALVYCCVTLFFDSKLAAQISEEKKTIDIRAYLNIAYTQSTSGRNSKTWDELFKPGIGASYHFNMGSFFSLQPGVFYNGYGYAIDKSESRSGVEEKHSLHYISIPVLSNFKIDRHHRFELFIGPQASFLAAAKSKLNGVRSNTTNQFRKFDLSGLVGFNIVPKKIPFYFTIMGSVGLTQIRKNTIMFNENFESNMNNSSLSFGAGYRF